MRGRDWQAERLCYLVHFSDGGAGTRYADQQLEVGHEIRDGDNRYTIERVKQPSPPYTLGHAWATLSETPRGPRLPSAGLEARAVRERGRPPAPYLTFPESRAASTSALVGYSVRQLPSSSPNSSAAR